MAQLLFQTRRVAKSSGHFLADHCASTQLNLGGPAPARRFYRITVQRLPLTP